MSVEQPTWPSQAPERSSSILTTPRSSEELAPSSTSSSPPWRRSSLARRSGTRRLSSKRSGATRRSSESSSTCGSLRAAEAGAYDLGGGFARQVEDGAGHQGLVVGEVGDGPGSRARCSGACHNLDLPIDSRTDASLSPLPLQSGNQTYKVLPHVDQQEMYGKVYRHLSDGKCLCIFPEGALSLFQDVSTLSCC